MTDFRIETERLILRRWRDSDRKPFSKMNADPKVMRYFPKRLTEEVSNHMVDIIEAEFEECGFGLFAVELQKGSDFIGYVGLHRPSFEAHFTPAVEIAWRLNWPFWRRGYASEAARSVLDFARDVVRLEEVVSFTSTLNLPSIGVMKKIGMVCDPAENFMHPKLPVAHELREHVLYRTRF